MGEHCCKNTRDAGSNVRNVRNESRILKSYSRGVLQLHLLTMIKYPNHTLTQFSNQVECITRNNYFRCISSPSFCTLSFIIAISFSSSCLWKKVEWGNDMHQLLIQQNKQPNKKTNNTQTYIPKDRDRERQRVSCKHIHIS